LEIKKSLEFRQSHKNPRESAVAIYKIALTDCVQWLQAKCCVYKTDILDIVDYSVDDRHATFVRWPTLFSINAVELFYSSSNSRTILPTMRLYNRSSKTPSDDW